MTCCLTCPCGHRDEECNDNLCGPSLLSCAMNESQLGGPSERNMFHAFKAATIDGGQMVTKTEVIQSMRAVTFGDFTVLGSQYRDQSGELRWYVALLSKDWPNFKIRHVMKGEAFEGFTQDEREVVAEAIEFWESEPASRPN
jgi:hypothetical protein